MVLKFFLFTVAFLFVSCTVAERNNPYDPDSPNWFGNSSSSAESVPGSSSSKPSSSSVASVVSSSSSVPVQAGIIYGKSVDYQGETYQTVLIGSQTWFKRNLNYAVEGSRCYDNDPANCETYGRLYTWIAAMALPSNCESNECFSQISDKHKGICPSGWHIPSKAEWAALGKFAGGGIKLKADNGWNSYQGKPGTGTDDYGFSALPSGCDNSSTNRAVGYHGLWWSSNENDINKTIGLVMSYNSERLSETNADKTLVFSIRCVKD
ncbi:MAG: hypothetical protein LBC75_07430 [Fibromonadaceae bacterium]|jgi:uncharacterized protein (TIGR02145 family)|nr:hypothetical protein [Fibromonadaceae bacterium]